MKTDCLTIPPLGLSLQFVTADSMNVDWRDTEGPGESYDVMLPRPTYGDVAQYAPDLLEEWIAAPDAFFDYEPLQEDCRGLDHCEAFARTDGYDEWADSYQPAMNYAWPVSLAYGLNDVEEVAALIDQFASACSLIRFDDSANPWGNDSDAPDYAIALTGGGMDLSDHIAAAYLCCGCVPPERILGGLGSFTGCNKSGRLARVPLAEAFEAARNYFIRRADQLENEAEKLGVCRWVDGAFLKVEREPSAV